MRLKNTFIQGKMNKDLDERLLDNGQYPHAENIRVSNSESSDIGAIENMLGNKVLTRLDFGDNPKQIFSVSSTFNDCIYWGIASDKGSYVLEYNTNTDTSSFVLQDERTGEDNVLGFDPNFIITGVEVLVDSDNEQVFLLFTDNKNSVKQINVERAKTFGLNNFTEDDVCLIKKPPLDSPKIELRNNEDLNENNIEEVFLLFSHRYRYKDGEYSAFSPFSQVAFLPDSFNYDFATSTNESMVNDFNELAISFNTGLKNVVSVDILFKESESSVVYLVDSFDKEEEGWADNTTQTITFSNNKQSKIIESFQISRYFDNVPSKAKSLELIGNRLVLGNYTENINLERDGKPINVELTLDTIKGATTIGRPYASVKSNRSYEVGINYLDDYGRATTVLTSENNTASLKNIDCLTDNELKVKVANKAPEKATHFRFFIKQNRGTYDSVIPTLFYQQGVFIWVKLENSDINKIKEGDFLYVKADTKEVLNKSVQTKVLEIKAQPRNFLVTDDTEKDTLQLAGTYFKIRPIDFRMNPNDFQTSVFNSYDAIRKGGQMADHLTIRDNKSYIAASIFYGEGLDDLTSSGTYTGEEDIRYLVQIDSVDAVGDTFKWSKDGGATFVQENVPITEGTAQDLDDGVKITFAAKIGHKVGDYWISSAKSSKRFANDFKADLKFVTFGIYKSVEDDTINGGARITITFDERGDTPQFYEKSFTSSVGYDNLEEWFYGDNVQDEFGTEISDRRVFFRRGTLGKDGQRDYVKITGKEEDPMFLLIGTSIESGEELNVFAQEINGRIEIFQSTSNIIFETKPDLENSDIFNELSVTYPIVNGLHTSTIDGDVSQTESQPAEITLPFFNCYSWGNGFESVKIRDAFIAKTLTLDTRPLAPIEDYRENHRIASLTYSQPYNQSTNYNGLNEFNLSRANFKDMDDAYGSIQKLHSRDTDLLVFQEDKTHKVLFEKNILYNADGTGNLASTNEVLGTISPYLGEFGISKNPESFAIYGNYIWHTDTRRGCVLQLTNNGYFEVSNNGMRDYFRDYFRNNINSRNFGQYDPYHDQYVYFMEDTQTTITYDTKVKGFTSFHSFIPDGMTGLNNRFYTFKDGQLYLHNSEGEPRNTYYGVSYPSKVSMFANQEPSMVKELQAISLEGSEPWSMNLKSLITTLGDFKQTTIKNTEFVEKEGLWFSYARRNELVNYESKATYGIGVVTNIVGNTLTVLGGSVSLTTNDTIVNQDLVSSGKVVSFVILGDSVSITLDSVVGIEAGNFVLGAKDNRIEGGNLRGYSFRYDLENSTYDKAVELYAVNSEVAKSFTS